MVSCFGTCSVMGECDMNGCATDKTDYEGLSVKMML